MAAIVLLLLFELQAPQEAVALEGMWHSIITYNIFSYKIITHY